MLTARERAIAAVKLATKHSFNWLGTEDAIDTIELMFMEHARDQRHLCAEDIVEKLSQEGALAVLPADKAHAYVMNTVAPGVVR